MTNEYWEIHEDEYEAMCEYYEEQERIASYLAPPSEEEMEAMARAFGEA